MISNANILQTILNLSTEPRHQEEEYEYTSDFLEWFYNNVNRGRGYENYPVLYLISKEDKYNTMCELSRQLINCNYAKNLDRETLTNRHNEIKEWLLDTLQTYDAEYL